MSPINPFFCTRLLSVVRAETFVVSQIYFQELLIRDSFIELRMGEKVKRCLDRVIKGTWEQKIATQFMIYGNEIELRIYKFKKWQSADDVKYFDLLPCGIFTFPLLISLNTDCK